MLSLLIAVLVGAPSAPKPDCATDRVALRQLGYDDFDETPGKGWRTVADRPGCLKEAADVIAEYRQARASDLVQGSTDNLRSLNWHEGQLRAATGDTKAALHLMQLGARYVDQTGDGIYHRATIAFLKGDRKGLTRDRNLTAALVEPSWFKSSVAEAKARGYSVPAWPPHLAEIDGFIACLGKPYADAYYGTCSKAARH